MTADEILEELRVKMDCSFLSDLPSLTGEQREKMLCLIEELPQIQRNGRKYSSICAAPRGADLPHGAVQPAFSAFSEGRSGPHPRRSRF